MARLKDVKVGADGWSEWVSPAMNGYRMACCDCGLVHNVRFKVVRLIRYLPDGTWSGKPAPRHKVLMQVSRNERSTVQVRRHAKKKARRG